jgi:type II secretory pathway component PulF
MTKKLQAMPERLAHGESLAVILGEAGMLKPYMSQIIMSGEQTGRLDESMTQIAILLETEAVTTIDRSMKLVGPVLLLVVAGFIGFKIVAFYSSYFGTINALTP